VAALGAELRFVLVISASIRCLISSMQSSIMTPRVAQLLDALYADAAQVDPSAIKAADKGDEQSEADFYRAASNAYLPVGREFGNLLYVLARSSRAQTIVEFGTSFGISTIFLAAAVRDQGIGRVVTTEFAPEKVERAKKNLQAAGLEEWVEFRVGDAMETLKAELPGPIDLLLLDGAKGMYLPVLQLLEPRLRSGCLVASDNTNLDGMDVFLKYLRAPENGYTTSGILTDGVHRGHEISLRN
jgi:predicted O-methyltransferase YrrM